jgi:hypothetical protein
VASDASSWLWLVCESRRLQWDTQTNRLATGTRRMAVQSTHFPVLSLSVRELSREALFAHWCAFSCPTATVELIPRDALDADWDLTTGQVVQTYMGHTKVPLASSYLRLRFLPLVLRFPVLRSLSWRMCSVLPMAVRMRLLLASLDGVAPFVVCVR